MSNKPSVTAIAALPSFVHVANAFTSPGVLSTTIGTLATRPCWSGGKLEMSSRITLAASARKKTRSVLLMGSGPGGSAAAAAGGGAGCAGFGAGACGYGAGCPGYAVGAGWPG